jgi:hypothetical protein
MNMKEIKKGQRTKRQREHHEGTGDKDIRREKETSCVYWGKRQGSSVLRALVQYTVRDKPNKVVKCPHHTENMQARGIRIQRQHKKEGDKEREKRA